MSNTVTLTIKELRSIFSAAVDHGIDAATEEDWGEDKKISDIRAERIFEELVNKTVADTVTLTRSVMWEIFKIGVKHGADIYNAPMLTDVPGTEEAFEELKNRML
jgi:hypothetical protein